MGQNSVSSDEIAAFIARWQDTGGSELANTQSFIGELSALIGAEPPRGSRTDDALNDYVYERRVFQDNGDGTQSFGRIDVYKRGCFILEAKQGSDADRASAERGEADLDLFGQTAATRLKRGTARRGTPGWAKAMVQAKGQAERYAKALPVDHGWPPFLLIADIGYCIEVFADFTGTGKAYAQFPDRSRYRIMLDDLHDEKVRQRLHAIWTAPATLDPATEAARVTRQVADLLATLSRRIEKRGHSADAVSGFLMRLLFTMFAEDTKVLLPENSFKALLHGQRDHPEHLHHQLSALWGAMDRGAFAPALGIPVKRFNGYLFKDTAAIPLDREELDVLIAAAEHQWTDVEPAIFGTLLERALNPKERAKLGAHYTPRAYVERLVGPTIIEPLRADWTGVRVVASELIDQGKADEARAAVEAFHAQLARTKVLDPACGTGNFLYVAMARMKELEGEVIDLLIELGDTQYVADLTGHTITPENFLGIELNPRAAAIAQLVLWIGYLQWHFRVNGEGRAPPEPILRDIRTIECRDALIDYEDRVLERDEQGEPITIWDGTSMKSHPTTGRLVPDESERREVYRFVRPRQSIWPRADFIVGNPPFIGSKRMRKRLSSQYVDAVRLAYRQLSGEIDFVTYWWARAAAAVAAGELRAFGLITTKTLAQSSNRPVLRAHLDAEHGGNLTLRFAIPNHPWHDSQTTAAVRIAMTVGVTRGEQGRLLTIVSERRRGGQVELEFDDKSGAINVDLTIGPNVAAATPLKANAGVCWMGMKMSGDGFKIDEQFRDTLASSGVPLSRMPLVIAGDDLTERQDNVFALDFFDVQREIDLRENYPLAYQHLLNAVKPFRDQNDRDQYRDIWWRFAEVRPSLRRSIHSLNRAIVTSETATHRVFTFVPVEGHLIDGSVIAIASDDSYVLGALSSRVHIIWALRAGGRLGSGDDPRYQNEVCFDPFPFPADVPEPLKDRIRAEAEALDVLRKRVLAEHDDLTLTRLYNVLEALKAGRALTDAERDIHGRGLVTLIRQHHDTIDAAVAEAYGWPEDLSDEDILARLVALNKERAAEEARGLIRYLRPEYQDAGYTAPVNENLDLGEAAVPLPDTVIPWPATLPEQVGAVQRILTAAPGPMAAPDIARSFKGKRAATVRPVLDALAAIGQARILEDGRYAA